MKKMNKKQRNALMRKMVVLIQLITLLGLVAAALLNQILPVKYVAVIAAGLFGFWLIFWGMQFLKNRIYLLGVVLSIVVSAAQFAGVFCIEIANIRPDKVMTEENKEENDKVEETDITENQSNEGMPVVDEEENETESESANTILDEYGEDTMLVVVKKDREAENINDAAEFHFGVHDVEDDGKTDEILAEIENETGNPVDVKKFDDILDTAWALLDGEVQAIVFNTSYMSEIEEEIEGYSSKVKIIYSVK